MIFSGTSRHPADFTDAAPGGVGRLVGRDVEEVLAGIGDFSAHHLVGDSQLRWLGPEKGVSHMAIGGIINALWDLRAKRAGKPVWRLLSDLAPDEIVAEIDFRYLSDALTPTQALEILRAGEEGKAARISELEASGYPAYTTEPGWLGYDDEKLLHAPRGTTVECRIHNGEITDLIVKPESRRADIISPVYELPPS